MNKYVVELPEKSGKSIHYEEVTASTGRPTATKQKEQSTPSLTSFSTIVVPIDQRKWKDIPLVDYIDERSLSFNVSKTMTRILRLELFVTFVLFQFYVSPKMDESDVHRLT